MTLPHLQIFVNNLVKSLGGKDFKSVFVEMLRIWKMADEKADKIEESFEIFQESIFIAAVFEV